MMAAGRLFVWVSVAAGWLFAFSTQEVELLGVDRLDHYSKSAKW